MKGHLEGSPFQWQLSEVHVLLFRPGKLDFLSRINHLLAWFACGRAVIIHYSLLALMLGKSIALWSLKVCMSLLERQWWQLRRQVSVEAGADVKQQILFVMPYTELTVAEFKGNWNFVEASTASNYGTQVSLHFHFHFHRSWFYHFPSRSCG